jgi:spermidine synthase
VLLPLALALGGFASMVDEVVWTRLLSLAVGSSVYAFSLILAAFITGLGLGSLIVSRFVGRVEECLLLPLFYGAEIVIGLFSLAIIPVLGRFPVEIVALTTRFSQSFSLLQAVEFFLFFLLFLIPTLLMGIVFPVAVTLYRRTGDVGRSIGILYSANTVGALIGSFAGGFLLIPLLGLRGTIIAAATVNLVIAMLLRPPLRLSTGLQTTVVALALILLILLLPEWDRAILTSGAHLYGRAPAGDITEEDVRIVYYKEGVTAVVSVIREGNHLSLKINGKTDASSGSSREDMRTQILSAHLPLLLHTNPQSVLVVGLGSGITLGSVLRHPVETVECVEISPDVVEASRYFDAYSGAPLDDPRVRLIVGDGRNHITLTDRRYDVIISEPSNPWIAGMSDLFTVEYFEQCRRHLNPGGVMCQWLQAYRMSDRDIGSVVRTFRSVFPHVVLWESTAGIDYLLTGTFDRDPVIDARDVEARLTDDRIRSDLRRIRVATLPDLLAHWITADGGIDRIAGSASIHTDDNALLEFSTPKSLYRSLTAHDIGRFASHRVDIAPLLTNVSPVFLNRISTARQARETSLSGIAHQLSGRFVEAETAFRQAIAINPDDADAVYFLSKIQVARGRAHARQNRIDEAIRTYRETLSIDSSNAVAHRELGYLYELKGMDSLAVEEYRQAVTADPAYPNARNTLGNFYLKRGDHDEAERVYREAIAIDPWYVNAYNNLGSLYARRGEHEKAGDLFRRAIHLDPTFVSAYNNLGNLYLLKGDHEKAAEQWKRSLRLDPENLRAKEGLKHLRHLSDQKGR